MTLTFKINRQSPEPLHLQVEKHLRQLINQPEYVQGKLLPKETDLAHQLGISRSTVRQAINKLVYEGLLERTKRLGTKVRPKRVSTNLENWYSFTQEMTEQGIPFSNYDIRAEWVEADAEICNLFELKSHQRVVRLSRLRGLENGPVVYFISYFNPLTGISTNENFEQPLYDLLESKYQVIPMISDEELSLDRANSELAKKLKVDLNTPLLFRKRKVFDQNQRCIELNLGWYRADRFVYKIKIKRGNR